MKRYLLCFITWDRLGLCVLKRPSYIPECSWHWWCQSGQVGIIPETVPGGKTRQHVLACAESSSPAAEREPLQFTWFGCVLMWYPKLSPVCSRGSFASLVLSRSHMAVYGLIIWVNYPLAQTEWVWASNVNCKIVSDKGSIDQLSSLVTSLQLTAWMLFFNCV